MAHFETQSKKIHGTTQNASAGTAFKVDLWGPLYQSVPPRGPYDQELVVVADPGASSVAIERGALSSDKHRRSYTIRALKPIDKVTIHARAPRQSQSWSQFDLVVNGPPGVKRITRQQMKSASGAFGWPGWKGACANVIALRDALKIASGGALAHDKPPTNPTLQGAGRNLFYEHSVGLALDVFLSAKNPASRRRAHNIIRFLVANREEAGFRNLFYEEFGFSQGGAMAAAPNHYDHFHIDWIDFSLCEPPGASFRGKWEAITWPSIASQNEFLTSQEAIDGLTEAWNDTSSDLITRAADLYE